MKFFIKSSMPNNLDVGKDVGVGGGIEFMSRNSVSNGFGATFSYKDLKSVT